MKKVLVFALTLILLFTFCSCDLESLGKKVNADVSRGQTDGNVYVNDYLDLTFTKNENMVFATDEELAGMMDIGLEVLDQAKDLFDLMAVTCFSAKDVTTGNNVMLVMENLTVSGSSNITEKQYIEAAKTQLNAQTVITYTFGDVTEVKLGDQTYTRLECGASAYGQSFSQYMYVRKVGKYMACITVTVMDGTTVSAIESMFS